MGGGEKQEEMGYEEKICLTYNRYFFENLRNFFFYLRNFKCTYKQVSNTDFTIVLFKANLKT